MKKEQTKIPKASSIISMRPLARSWPSLTTRVGVDVLFVWSGFHKKSQVGKMKKMRTPTTTKNSLNVPTSSVLIPVTIDSILFACIEIGSCQENLKKTNLAATSNLSFQRRRDVQFVEERWMQLRLSIFSSRRRSTPRSKIMAMMIDQVMSSATWFFVIIFSFLIDDRASPATLTPFWIGVQKWLFWALIA